MNENKNLLRLLHLEILENNETIEGRFKTIADLLFQKYQINKGTTRYDFLEIEFYYYTDGHEDITTYRRNSEAGMWFLHNSGVDITFKSQCNDKKTANEKVENKKEFYGGILIRSLLKTDKKNNIEDKVICGPIKCADDLFHFNVTNINDAPVLASRTTKPPSIDNVMRYIGINGEDKKKYYYCYNNITKHSVQDKYKKQLTRIVTIEVMKGYLKKGYRYIVEKIKDEWDKSDRKDYKADPWDSNKYPCKKKGN